MIIESCAKEIAIRENIFFNLYVTTPNAIVTLEFYQRIIVITNSILLPTDFLAYKTAYPSEIFQIIKLNAFCLCAY